MEARGSAGSSVLRFILVNDIYKPKKLAALPSLINRLKSEVENCKFIIGGDFMGGSTFAAKSQGESIIDLLEAMEVDYVVLGNHEFDYGHEMCRKMMDKSTFSWFGSNARDTDGSIFHSAKDFEILKLGSTTIGIFGLITEATPHLSLPGDGVRFESSMEHAKRVVGELQSHNCDFIVALTHLSINKDKMLTELPIDLILGGHDHTPFFLEMNHTTVLKCGQDAEFVGFVDVDLSSCTIIPQEEVMLETAKLSLPEDKKMVDIIKEWRLKCAAPEDAEDVACVTDSQLSTLTKELRSQETNFGTFVADAMKNHVLEQFSHFMNPEIPLIGVINGGFIRANTTYDVGQTLTTFDFKEEMPFTRCPVLFELTGKQLRQGIEQMLRLVPDMTGAFPHFSNGFRATFDPSQPFMNKLVDVKIYNQPLEDTRQYFLVIQDAFYIKACDGVTAFRELGKVVAQSEVLVWEVVRNYARSMGTIPGRLQHRFQPV